MVLNLSWPAVSQIYILTDFPAISKVLILKSTPMVGKKESENIWSENLNKRELYYAWISYLSDCGVSNEKYLE